MHHSPSGPTTSERLRAVRTSWWQRGVQLRGKIAPVVLVCGIVAGIALVLPDYAPAVTSAEGGLGAAAASSGAATPEQDRSDVVTLGVDGGEAAVAAPAAPGTTEAAPAAPAETPAATPSAEPTAEETTPAETPAETAEAEESGSAPSAPAPAPAASAPAPAAAPADPSAEGQVLALVNQERAAAGCGPVAADAGLAAVARAFSADMRDRGFFSHVDPDGLSPFDRGDRAGVTVLAENIAYGQPDAASVMEAWMNSSGHRANILNCSLTRLGVGVAQGAGGPWWTQNFA
ncbi:CAP domain-containing protein [Blastococcus sp. SYSU D00669]